MATALEPKQKLIAAYAVLCQGVAQHIMAAVFEVNPGRINEAVQAARTAFEFPTKIERERDDG
jgi:hypothetical protein